jgi:hypothetical protein
MSREPKKKPGDMAIARHRHLQDQERRDALAKLRNGEHVEVWALHEQGSARVKVAPYDPKEQDLVLCIYSRRLHVMTLVNHDGWRVVDQLHNAIIPLKQVVGVVTEVLEIKPSKVRS